MTFVDILYCGNTSEFEYEENDSHFGIDKYILIEIQWTKENCIKEYSNSTFTHKSYNFIMNSV